MTCPRSQLECTQSPDPELISEAQCAASTPQEKAKNQGRKLEGLLPQRGKMLQARLFLECPQHTLKMGWTEVRRP